MIEIIDDEITTEIAEATTNALAEVTLTKHMDLEKMLEMSTMLSKSTIIPQTYRNYPENVFVAMEMAQRMDVPLMMVMQNLYVIQGKPSWSGASMGAMVMANPNFTNVELKYVGTPNTDSWGAYVTAINKKTGNELRGATVTITTAKKEGWYQKSGSKWQTIPELMLAYRAYSWFARVYMPQAMMGLNSVEEVEDISTPTVASTINPYEKGDK